jgi:alcohol dehydrogenase class IV
VREPADPELRHRAWARDLDVSRDRRPFNADYVGERYVELGGDAESLARRLEDLAQAGGLPRRLADDGVGEDDLPKLAQEAAEPWTGGFNPRPFDAAAALELDLYRGALGD